MFDPRKQTPNVHNNILDPVTILTNSWEPHNFDFQVPQKLGNQFRAQKVEDHEDDDDGGASSPPLWQNSPPRSSIHPINYRSLSPSSRTQAIARGQWELMEMVKNMPESCFELSLKDLVEHPKSLESQKECFINNNTEKNQVVQNIKIKNEQIRKTKMMMRSKSVGNGGVFIKMVSPVSLRPKKKKNKNLLANTTRITPKPEECENSSSKNLEKEWWKKRFSGSSSGSSNNGGSSGRNRSRGSSSNSSSSNSTSSRNNSNRKREGYLCSCWSSLCLSNSIPENNKVMTDAADW